MRQREAPLLVVMSLTMTVPAGTAIGATVNLVLTVHVRGVPLAVEPDGYRSVTLQPMVLTSEGNLTDCGSHGGVRPTNAACADVANVDLAVPLDANGRTMTPFHWNTSLAAGSRVGPDSPCCGGGGSNATKQKLHKGKSQAGDNFASCGWGLNAYYGYTSCSLSVQDGSTWTKLLIFYCDSSCISDSFDWTTGSVHNYPGTTSTHDAWWYQGFVDGAAQGGSACTDSKLQDHTVDSPGDYITQDPCTGSPSGFWGVGMYWH